MSFAHLHAAGYARLLHATPGVEVLIADDDATRGRYWADELGVPLFDSYTALLDHAPDGVVICAENVRHRPLTEVAAAAGAAVLCEKPLATTEDDARAMIDACAAAGVTLMTAFPMRFSPPVAALAAAVGAGQVGRIHAMTGTNPGRMPTGWFTDPRLSGGGAVTDHTVHLADLMCWLTGSEPATVYAQTNDLIHPDAGVETGGLIAVTFTDGTVATIDCSWSRLDTYPTWGTVTLEVVGDGGVLTVDAFRQHITTYTDTTRWRPFGTDPDAGLVAEFLAAIRDRRPTRPDGVDGYRATAVALAAYRSAATGQPAAVTPLAEPRLVPDARTGR